MSESDAAPSPCPACGAVVTADDVLARDACPECGTDLSDLFRLAEDRGGRRV